MFQGSYKYTANNFWLTLVKRGEFNGSQHFDNIIALAVCTLFQDELNGKQLKLNLLSQLLIASIYKLASLAFHLMNHENKKSCKICIVQLSLILAVIHTYLKSRLILYFIIEQDLPVFALDYREH